MFIEKTKSDPTVFSVELTFVCGRSTQTDVHVRPAAPASRANLAAPANDNVDWDEFLGIEVDYMSTVLSLHVFMNNKLIPLRNIVSIIVIL